MSTYYVSPDGSDKTGTGTKDNPFATIGRADELRLLRAGDVVSVAPGEYDSIKHTFSMGTFDAPIVYKGAQGTVVKRHARFGTVDYPTVHIVVEKMEFKTGVRFHGAPQGCVVRKCLFDIPAGGLCAAFNYGDLCAFTGNKVIVKVGGTTALAGTCAPRRVVVANNTVIGGKAEDFRDTADAPTRNHFPNTKKYITLQGDFHVHTSDGSDATVSLMDRMAEAKRNGLDVIAITDHGCDVVRRDYVAEQRKNAEKLSRKTGVIYLKGFETGLGYDPLNWREHVVAFGSDAEPKEYDHTLKEDGGEEDVLKRLEEIAKEGGYLIWAHPDSDYPGIELADELAREPIKKAIDKGWIKGIEVVNGATAYEPGEFWGDVYEADMGPRGGWLWTRAVDYALKHNLTMFANTDAHHILMPCYTLLLVKERSEKGVMDAIKAGRTAAYFEDMLWGRPEVIEELMSSMALLSRHCPRPEIKKDKVAFTNNSPMILMPEVKGKVYVIRPCETLHLFVPAGESVSVKWTNVYIGGKKCYEKEY